MIYIQLIFIVLILVFLFLDWKYGGKGNTVACLGLLVALFSTPYFTFSTDLRRHHQEIIWKEKYSVFREQLYDVHSLHLHFQSLIKEISSYEFSKESREVILGYIEEIQEGIKEINLNSPYYRLVLEKEYEVALKIYINELALLVGKLKENIVDRTEIDVHNIITTDEESFEKYYSRIDLIYTKDFEYGK